jgi:hypothetical protein
MTLLWITVFQNVALCSLVILMMEAVSTSEVLVAFTRLHAATFQETVIWKIYGVYISACYACIILFLWCIPKYKPFNTQIFFITRSQRSKFIFIYQNCPYSPLQSSTVQDITTHFSVTTLLLSKEKQQFKQHITMSLPFMQIQLIT